MSAFIRWITTVCGTYRLWRALLYALDAAVVVIATLLAYYARFEGQVPSGFARTIPLTFAAALVTYVLLFGVFGLYTLVLRYVGVDTGLRLGAATVLGFAILCGFDLAVTNAEGLRVAPFGVLFIQATVVFLGSAAIRLAMRVALLLRSRQGAESGRRILIVGAGSAGSLLVREIQARPDLGLIAVGFLDDDPDLIGRTVAGLRVVGMTDQLVAEVAKHRAQEIAVAMPGAPPERIRAILNMAADAGITTRIVPALVIDRHAVRIADLRNVQVEDLLGREQTLIDTEQIADTIRGRVVAVTGAAGSIGSELCRQIIRLGPQRLLLVEIDETRLYELFLELSALAPNVPVMCLCDIRDAAKVNAVFSTYKPCVVLHAAAYKHVPLMELAPEEAVKTNVLGTRNIIETCESQGAERFVLISTDKAVAPANIMGLTKALAELVMLSAARRGDVLAVAVRFGNVLASRGSVVPIFETQLGHGGPITVTDPAVTRYFMTIPEAARLVLQAQAIGESGDIFVLEMGEPIRILDLARKMIALSGVPADIEFIGLRPGEKMHEALVHAHEGLVETSAAKVLRVVSPAVVDPSFDEAASTLIAVALNGDCAGVLRQLAVLDPEFVARQAELD